jgi:hypothetical protein
MFLYLALTRFSRYDFGTMSDKPKKRQKSKPSWSDIKNKLADFDRAGLMQLVADLYAFSKDNQTFMHARFSLVANPLDDYKKRISLALAPDLSRRNANPSVATAKKSISEYTKAVGNPPGILELRVFWCETAVEFSLEYGYADIGYLEALLRQYRDACQVLPDIPEPQLTEFIERMQCVRDDAAQIGYGVFDEMSDLLEDVLVNLPESTEEARIPMIGE